MKSTIRCIFLVFTLCAASRALAALHIVATTPEYGAIASVIGGDRVVVTNLAKATEDPHFVDAKPSHIVTLNRADLLIEGGADLEAGWLPPLLDGARNPRIAVGAPGHIRASDGVLLLDVPTVLDRSHGDVHAAGNPHFMMDPTNAGIVAGHITKVLCSMDKPSCPEYTARRLAFTAKLDGRIKQWEAALAPFKATPLVTYHPTWKYFAVRFGLLSDLFLEPKPGIPPSPPHLAEVMQKMKDGKIRLVLVEPFQSRKTAEAVAARTGATVEDVCQFPGGLPGTANDYIALMDANVQAILAGLTATK